MTDTYDHTLNSAEKYFRGKHLQNVRSMKSNKKQFQSINRDIVTPVEVFEAFIESDVELAINNDEYLQLIEQTRI